MPHPTSPPPLVQGGRANRPAGRSADNRRPLAGSVAMVTGAGRGIGQLAALALADAGASVALVARSADELSDTLDLIAAAGGVAAAEPADVTTPHEITAAIASLRAQLGPIDLLVNNAGTLGPIGPLWEVDPVEWWTTMDVNLRGIMLCAHAVLPAMVAARRGRIINLTSQAGVHRWPLVSAYSVSKAAVVKLTENLALETRRYGIAVFSVHPGLLPIGMSQTVNAHATTTPHERHVRRWTLAQLAAGHGAEPDQAIELLLRIASGDADVLSGRHLSVHDDLDAILSRLTEVLTDDLYVLRPQPLRGGHVGSAARRLIRQTPIAHPPAGDDLSIACSRHRSVAGRTVLTMEQHPHDRPARRSANPQRRRRPAAAPAYYLQRPAAVWLSALGRPGRTFRGPAADLPAGAAR
jgi:NAD(P)-dependent dehydrogenase (short-subunit alcohol dehydrogenase family)